jgi:hypothetical protein
MVSLVVSVRLKKCEEVCCLSSHLHQAIDLEGRQGQQREMLG